jgi:WD40 repeat protein
VKIWPQEILLSAGETGPSGKALTTLRREESRRSMALSPDGRWVATLDGKIVRLWDRRGQVDAPALELTEHKGDMRSLVFSADSQKLVSASTDRTARVWFLRDLKPGTRPMSKELSGGHSAALTSASFSPDGSMVVTSAADQNVRIWSAESGVELAVLLFRHKGKVNEAIFDRSGKNIISVSDDGTAIVTPCESCSLPLKELMARAKDWAKLAPGESVLTKEEQAPWWQRLRWRLGMADK